MRLGVPDGLESVVVVYSCRTSGERLSIKLQHLRTRRDLGAVEDPLLQRDDRVSAESLDRDWGAASGLEVYQEPRCRVHGDPAGSVRNGVTSLDGRAQLIPTPG